MYHKIDLDTKNISRIGVNAYYSRIHFDIDERTTWHFESGSSATIAFDNKSHSIYIEGDVTAEDLNELMTAYRYYDERITY